MMRIVLRNILVVWLVFTFQQSLALTDADPHVKQFIHEMSKSHGFKVADLQATFAKVKKSDKVLRAISTPYEAKPWHLYRKHFLTDKRIKGGVKFWKQYNDLLMKEEQAFGVPAQVVVAIIGVESFYGAYQGGYRVIDALSTLAFYYPKRSAFFGKELEEFLLMCREKNIDPLEPTGSYAGAMGWPQFMPSSYRRHAVDFNHNGKADIWRSPADVMGSIGNYLNERGKWKKGHPVTEKVMHAAPESAVQYNSGRRPKQAASEWSKKGLHVAASHKKNKANPLRFDMGSEQYEYWLAYNNFYAIMSYNPRVSYAMAVYQLSEAIKDEYNKQLSSHSG
jgi:membrane-bound lytic murein transglycosylase B